MWRATTVRGRGREGSVLWRPAIGVLQRYLAHKNPPPLKLPQVPRHWATVGSYGGGGGGLVSEVPRYGGAFAISR